MNRILAAIKLDIVDPGTGTPPPGAERLVSVAGWLLWAVFVACVVGIAVAGAKLATASGGRAGGEHWTPLIMAIVGAFIAGSAAAIVSAVA